MDERFLEMGEFISRVSEELKEKAMERYAKARSINEIIDCIKKRINE